MKPLPKPRRLTLEEGEERGIEEEVFAALRGMTKERRDEEQQRFIEEILMGDLEREGEW